MSNRIFPFDLKNIKWQNYSSYLNWINIEIDSLDDYLTYRQPLYRILNEPTGGINLFSLEHEEMKNPKQEVLFENLRIFPILYKEEGQEIIKENGYFSTNTENTTITPFRNKSNGNGYKRQYYPVEASESIHIEATMFLDIATYCFIDENNSLVGDRPTNTSTWTSIDDTVVVPANAKFLVLQFSDQANIKVFEGLENNHTSYKLLFPNFLKNKEGVYNPYPNTYLSFDTISSNKLKEENGVKYYQLNNIEFGQLIKNKKLQYCPMSFVVFANKWIHNGQHSTPWSSETTDIKHYFLMAQSFAPLYGIESGTQQIIFKCYDDGPGVLGSSFMFSIEPSISRYFITRHEYSIWDSGASIFQLLNYNWGDREERIISSSKNLIWTDSFITMPHIESRSQKTSGSKKYEIVDEYAISYETSSKELNIANHLTLSYNIITKEDGNNTKKWNEFVSVNII